MELNLDKCQADGHAITQIRHYEKNCRRPFTVKFMFCETCGTPIACRFILYDPAVEYPKVKDYARASQGNIDVPKPMAVIDKAMEI